MTQTKEDDWFPRPIISPTSQTKRTKNLSILQQVQAQFSSTTDFTLLSFLNKMTKSIGSDTLTPVKLVKLRWIKWGSSLLSKWPKLDEELVHRASGHPSLSGRGLITMHLKTGGGKNGVFHLSSSCFKSLYIHFGFLAMSHLPFFISFFPQVSHMKDISL